MGQVNLGHGDRGGERGEILETLDYVSSELLRGCLGIKLTGPQIKRMVTWELVI